MTNKYAVCTVCQRSIVNGAKNGIMKAHPRQDVFIDVQSENWEIEFNPGGHYCCGGEGTVPQVEYFHDSIDGHTQMA